MISFPKLVCVSNNSLRQGTCYEKEKSLKLVLRFTIYTLNQLPYQRNVHQIISTYTPMFMRA